MNNQPTSNSMHNEVNRKIVRQLILRHEAIKGEIARINSSIHTADRRHKDDKGLPPNMDWMKYKEVLQAQNDGIEFSIYTILDEINDQDFRNEMTEQFQNPSQDFYSRHALPRGYYHFKHAYEVSQGLQENVSMVTILRNILRAVARFEMKRFKFIREAIENHQGDLSITGLKENLSEESLNEAWKKGSLSGRILKTEDALFELRQKSGHFPEDMRKQVWGVVREERPYRRHFEQFDSMGIIMQSVYKMPWFIGSEIYKKQLNNDWKQIGDNLIFTYQKPGMKQERFAVINKDRSRIIETWEEVEIYCGLAGLTASKDDDTITK